MYDSSSTEKKWQAKWEEAKSYVIDLKKAKDPYFSHVMFPYPSGDKLHVGHWYNYGPADSFSRYQRMLGKDVFCPFGFDAFGLPAENYAIKTGVHPDDSITTNVETMIIQLKRIGCMYDWDKMVNTSKPEYYRWTQWLFLQMYKNKLAYRKDANVNWCESCKTVLANEQVWEGKCERCDTDIVLKPMTQWYWKVKDYAQKLLDGLENLDWPEKTKTMQRNWIGRSEGMNFTFKVKDSELEFEVYDSVPQTYRAQTFAVIAPEHPMLLSLIKGQKNEKEVLDFIERMKAKKATQKYNFDEDLEGVFTGRFVEFVTGDLPLWVASFAVMDYGSGIVNCSAHDERDFAFAKKYDIPLHVVMVPEDEAEAEKVRNLEYCFFKDPQGVMLEPEEFKGRRWGEVRQDIIKYLEKEGIGYPTVQYKLRDWSISRQRYWGAPIPIVYDPEGNPHPIPEEHLPWELPRDVDFKPTGVAPLAASKELLERTEAIFGKGWTPEVDTMDTFVCSSFYSFMYLSTEGYGTKFTNASPTASDREAQFIDPTIEKNWMPVDMYIGGPEHACMHLIYSRFVTMALKDFGYVSHEEPYKRLIHQGLITNGGAKMSKSKGNVVSPDAFVEQYGSDVFRMYLMFMGPFEGGGDWSDTGIKGIDRFVQKVWKLFGETEESEETKESKEVEVKLHQTIKKVTEDIERLHFNTCISALMELMNTVEKHKTFNKNLALTVAKLLSPLAPHLAEELWEKLGGPAYAKATGSKEGFVIDQPWPTYDEKMCVSATVEVAVQINGKLRGTITIDAAASEADVITLAKEVPNVLKNLEGKEIKKEIYVPGKLVSLVI